MNFKYKLQRNIKLMSLFNVFYNFRLYSVLAVIYFSQITHSYSLAASIFAIVQISQAFFEIPTGFISDKHGRSLSIKLGAFSNLLAIIFYAFSKNYLFLVIGAIFEGLNRAFFSGNNNALIYETLSSLKEKSNYHKEFGKINSWLELAGFVSCVLGGFVALKSLSLLFTLSTIPQLIASLLSLGFVEPKRNRSKITSLNIHIKESLKTLRKNIKLRYLSIVEILGFAVGESTWSLQSVFYNLFLPVPVTNWVMSLNYLTSTVSFRLSGKILSKFKAIKVLLYQEIYGRLLYLIALIFPSVLSPFIIATASVTYGPSTVAHNTLLQQGLTNHQRAIFSSVNSFIGSCLYALMTIFIGYLADNFGITKAILFGQICLLPISVIYYKLSRLDKINH